MTALTPPTRDSRMRSHAPLLALMAGLAFLALLYLPGLSGPWLLDDFINLGPFLDHAPGAAPYAELMSSNRSGPLGRPVAMASFAANHALDLFDTPALKATNLALHLGNSLLAYALLLALFRRRAPTNRVAPATLAALLAFAWVALPLHISSVLYIVQRMTVLAATFSLLTLLTFVHGRVLLANRPGRGAMWLAASVLIAFPLAIFTKETAATTLAALVLIELFFFREQLARPLLAMLVTAVALALALIALTQPAFLAGGYTGRDFSLDERLLTQPRVLLLYAKALLLPGAADIGLVHDDLIVSRSLIDPASTLAALFVLGATLVASVALAASARFWAVAFGLAFFLSGHLLESTALSLELYFEHRNYLPGLGLVVAVASLLAALPLRGRLLALVGLLWLGLLLSMTAHRANTWGDEGRLLEASARHHPGSLTAVTSWGEYLFARDPAGALGMLEGAIVAAPANADVLLLQQLSLYCRLRLTPPPALVEHLAQALGTPRRNALPVRIGLDDIRLRAAAGDCGGTDFRPLRPALLHYDQAIRLQFGNRIDKAWQTRLALANWLLALGDTAAATPILRELWRPGEHARRPLAGLALAQALAAVGDAAGLDRVLADIDAVTADAPADFREQLNALRQPKKDSHD